jgi:hypothetical protein
MFSSFARRLGVAPVTAAFLGLLPALALTQTGQTLPANTVVSRMGVGPGPAQAIPFARFQSPVSGPCATATAGLVLAIGGRTTNFLRADCTFAPRSPTTTCLRTRPAPRPRRWQIIGRPVAIALLNAERSRRVGAPPYRITERGAVPAAGLADPEIADRSRMNPTGRSASLPSSSRGASQNRYANGASSTSNINNGTGNQLGVVMQ